MLVPTQVTLLPHTMTAHTFEMVQASDLEVTSTSASVSEDSPLSLGLQSQHLTVDTAVLYKQSCS